ncbi:hypothetical protein [Streptomyces sp. SID5643]|uniref:hypothetical protein n=1 Tax=Streptomyces sp. SID5643 TaxID=2690307 RepID=UPI00136F33E0|nr:hypothetical protein [Streptomyces sp. SID5643]MZF86026.1 hypothetical protein [Streptomyces sp. SID5643]
MTSKDAQSAIPTVLLRSVGEVDEETPAYARTKIDAVVGRPGLPATTGEVRITRAAAHHADRPWAAAAALHVGRREVVVLAEAATGRELVDQLQTGCAARPRRPPARDTTATTHRHRRGVAAASPQVRQKAAAGLRTLARREPAVSAGPVGGRSPTGSSAPPHVRTRTPRKPTRTGHADQTGDQRPTDGTCLRRKP